MLSIYRVFTSTSPEESFDDAFTWSFGSFTYKINISFKNNTEFYLKKKKDRKLPSFINHKQEPDIRHCLLLQTPLGTVFQSKTLPLIHSPGFVNIPTMS